MAQQRLGGATGQEEGVREPDPVVVEWDLGEDDGRRRGQDGVLERGEEERDAEANDDGPEAEATLDGLEVGRRGGKAECVLACVVVCLLLLLLLLLLRA